MIEIPRDAPGSVTCGRSGLRLLRRSPVGGYRSRRRWAQRSLPRPSICWNSSSTDRSGSVTTTLYPARSRAARRASTASRVAWLSSRGRRLPGTTARSWYFPGVPSSDHGTSYGPLLPLAPPFAVGLAERRLDDRPHVRRCPVLACSTACGARLLRENGELVGTEMVILFIVGGADRVVARGRLRVLQIASQLGGRATEGGLRPPPARIFCPLLAFALRAAHTPLIVPAAPQALPSPFPDVNSAKFAGLKTPAVGLACGPDRDPPRRAGLGRLRPQRPAVARGLLERAPPNDPLPTAEDQRRRPHAGLPPAVQVQGVWQPRGRAVLDREPSRTRRRPERAGGAAAASAGAVDASPAGPGQGPAVSRRRAEKQLGVIMEAQRKTGDMAKGASAGGKKDGPRGVFVAPRDTAPILAEMGIDKHLVKDAQDQRRGSTFRPGNSPPLMSTFSLPACSASRRVPRDGRPIAPHRAQQ